LGHFHAFKPNPDALVGEKVETDYVAATQNPNYQNDPRWCDPGQRNDFIKDTELKFLRPYQLRAIWALQDAVRQGRTRFLFEMATGTGKTLTAAVIFAHNHPSGDLQPSEADRRTHEQLTEAAKILGIRVLDHIIVTKKGYLSFQEARLIR